MSIEAMKQALEALETCMYPQQKQIQAITSLRQAIEQAEKQELVALQTVYETIIHWDEGGGKRSRKELARRIVDLYITPPAAQRQWIGLTDEEIYQIGLDTPIGATNFARALEAKLKEKND